MPIKNGELSIPININLDPSTKSMELLKSICDEPVMDNASVAVLNEPNKGHLSIPIKALSSCTKSWKTLFEGNFKESLKLSKLDYYVVSKVDGVLIIKASKEIIEEGISYWKSCLVGEFLGKTPPFFLVKNMVETLWKKFGKVEIKPGDDDLYVFRFEDENKSRLALE